jgi:hypothetical protein
VKQIYLKKAILHTFRHGELDMGLSTELLDLTTEFVRGYVENKISKMATLGAKFGVLDGEASTFNRLLCHIGEGDFISATHELAKHWKYYYTQSEDTPNADLLIVTYEQDRAQHVAFLKLPLKKVERDAVTSGKVASGLANTIAHAWNLPSKASSAEEGVMLNLESMQFLLQEKKYHFSGEKHEYLSEFLLKTENTTSIERMVNATQAVVKRISRRYDTDSWRESVKLKKAIYDSLEEYGTVQVADIAKEVFENNHSAQLELIEELHDIAVSVDEVEAPELDNDLFYKKYGTQKLELTNGISLSMSNEVLADKERMEFIENEDGTLTLIVKNIEDVVCKM